MQSAHLVQASAAGCRQAGPADATYVAGSPLQSQEEQRIVLRSAKPVPRAPSRGRPLSCRRSDAAGRAAKSGGVGAYPARADNGALRAQFNSASLNRHLSQAYNANVGGYSSRGFVEVRGARLARHVRRCACPAGRRGRGRHG